MASLSDRVQLWMLVHSDGIGSRGDRLDLPATSDLTDAVGVRWGRRQRECSWSSPPFVRQCELAYGDEHVSHTSWPPVVALLKRQLGPPGDELLDIAARLDLMVPSDCPAIVLRAKISERLEPALFDRPARKSTAAQLRLLEELAEETRTTVHRPESSIVADAWIAVLVRRNRIAALEILQLNRGDLVEDKHDGQTALVSSIGRNGLVYFRARHGCSCARPSSLRLIARVGTPQASAALRRYSRGARL